MEGKKYIWKEVATIIDMGGAVEIDFNIVFNKLNALQKQYNPKDLRLRMYDYGHVGVCVEHKMLETDEQLSNRVIREKEKREEIKQRDLKLLAELKKKYE